MDLFIDTQGTSETTPTPDEFVRLCLTGSARLQRISSKISFLSAKKIPHNTHTHTELMVERKGIWDYLGVHEVAPQSSS